MAGSRADGGELGPSERLWFSIEHRWSNSALLLFEYQKKPIGAVASILAHCFWCFSDSHTNIHYCFLPFQYTALLSNAPPDCWAFSVHWGAYLAATSRSTFFGFVTALQILGAGKSHNAGSTQPVVARGCIPFHAAPGNRHRGEEFSGSKSGRSGHSYP